MKNKNFRYHFLMSMSISLCLFWISSVHVKAQVTDSVVIVNPQPAEMVQWTTYKAKKQKQLPRAVLNLNAGYGWRIGKITDELNAYGKDFFSHLMSGFVWDASFDYFFNDKFGIRTAFYQYRASHNDLARELDTGKQGTLDVKDMITYIGPAFVFRLAFGHNSWIFTANTGMGYIEYREKQTFVNDYSKFYGASLGVQMGVDLEYKITPQLSIGTNMRITSGEINRLDYEKNGVKWTETFDVGKGEGLGQISLGIGFRYYFK